MGTIFYTAPVAPHVLINAFFLYSFLGWVMECIVIRREKGRWENRGFAHLPFCIIYGFGAMLGFALLRPFSGNYVLLYLVGAVLATLFEYLTARLMLRLFGTFWWDYTNKPFNYKGILCLESTLGWGLIALLLRRCDDLVAWRLYAVAPPSAAAGGAGKGDPGRSEGSVKACRAGTVSGMESSAESMDFSADLCPAGCNLLPAGYFNPPYERNYREDFL